MDTPYRVYRNLDVDETGVLVTSGKHELCGCSVYNAGAAVRYLKFYDKATAPASTDTPVLTVGITPTSSSFLSAEVPGIAFALGIGVRATTDVADAGIGAPGGNEVILNLFYR
jgi:hypothetical protein